MYFNCASLMPVYQDFASKISKMKIMLTGAQHVYFV